MNLFEIKQSVMDAYNAAVDPETGEIVDEQAFDALDELEMAFDEKVENIAVWIKDLKARAEALKAEKLAFEERQRKALRKAASLSEYLARVLNGQKREYTRAAISFRKSEALVVDDLALVPVGYLVMKEPDVDKTRAKRDLKAGAVIPGVHVEEKSNISIK